MKCCTIRTGQGRKETHAKGCWEGVTMSNINNNVVEEILFVCYPKCTTCQRASKHLERMNVSFVGRDIKGYRPKKDELAQWIAKSGLPLQKFFNASGLIYKEKNLKEVLPTLSDDEKIELLASDGMLVKRPILVLKDKVVVGYREEEYQKLFDE